MAAAVAIGFVQTTVGALLQVLFDRLASTDRVRNFIRGLDIEQEWNKLNKTLRDVSNFLCHAEDKEYKDDAMKIWLDQIKDAIYDAEDLIDELETQYQNGPDDISFLQGFKSAYQSRLVSFNDKFDKLARERVELGLDKIAAGSWRPIETRVTTSLVDESRIYGRGMDKEKILKLLLKDEPSHDMFSVISIVGMAGVGKTTLAQLAYTDTSVDERFDLKIWVFVSDQFDVKRITKTILKSITQATCDSMDWNDFEEFDFDQMSKGIVELVTLGSSDFIDLNHIQLKLKNKLNGKKFLIVLDDVWHKQYDDWDLLQKPFRVGAAGSRIVVTTRNQEVATMMGASSIHHLKHLSDNDCWSVFKEHASVTRSSDSELTAMKKKVARKCKGLPLVAKILGGLVRSTNKYEWENVMNNNVWDLPEESGILPVLKLSYNYLPAHLKHCFAYCSILPTDYEFGEEELVLLWMAEGFLQHPKGKMDIEDFGHKCFFELLSRSFFQPSFTKESLFVMHPLMSDLAQWVAGQTCLRLEDLPHSIKQSRITWKARHSSFNMNWSEGIKKFESFRGVGSLRTFLPLKGVAARDCRRYLTSYVLHELLPTLKCLRVLSFSGYHIEELPDSISKLEHLRFLNLSETAIKSLPAEICALPNLLTLLLVKCLELKELPTDLETLVNLRHLDITGSKLKAMPPNVSRLTNLRKLTDFVVGKDTGTGIAELMNLKYLTAFHS